jgi:hypothetical protein
MSATSHGTLTASAAPARQFIRGDSGRAADGRLVAAVAVAVAALASGTLTLYLATSALHSGATGARFASQGTPVQVAVTGCEAVSSGIGQLVQFYDCYGSYSIAGRSYQAMIAGERAHLIRGEILKAVGTPGPVPLLALASSVPRSGVDWLPAAASGVVSSGLGLTSFLLWLRRRRSASNDPWGPSALSRSMA